MALTDAVTAFHPYGGPGIQYGAFTGKAQQVIVARDTGAGSSKGKRRRYSRYPRRVSIDGRLVWVRNAEEERRLLEAHRAALEAEAERLAQSDAPADRVAQARIKVVRAQRRIDTVDDRQAAWLERLRQEDEEILLMLH